MEALNEQRYFLRVSCEQFDKGSEAEAKRIATIVSCLVKDEGRNSKSILEQSGLKKIVKFWSSARTVAPGTYPSTRLAILHVDSRGGQFLPLCRDPLSHPLLSQKAFSRWWDEIVIQSPPGRGGIIGLPKLGATISRKNLIANLRDQDGGAHLDSKLTDPAYIDVSIHGRTGVAIGFDNQKPSPAINAHLASMRQIGWELEYILRNVPGGPTPAITCNPSAFESLDTDRVPQIYLDVPI